MSATLYVSTMPKPDETVVNVQPPRMTNYSWTDNQSPLLAAVEAHAQEAS